MQLFKLTDKMDDDDLFGVIDDTVVSVPIESCHWITVSIIFFSSCSGMLITTDRSLSDHLASNKWHGA